jgi:hypothetical protein
MSNFKPNLALSHSGNQSAFIKYAHAKLFNLSPKQQYYSKPDSYNKEFYNPSWQSAIKLSPNQLEHVKVLYREGFFVYKVLHCSFTEFLFQITARRTFHRSSYWYTQHGTNFRHPLKYQRGINHKEKTLTKSDQYNQDWRENKGFDRDYRRQNRSQMGGPRKTWSKIRSNRSYRRHIKQKIQSQKYEDIESNQDMTYFNSYDWD